MCNYYYNYFLVDCKIITYEIEIFKFTRECVRDGSGILFIFPLKIKRYSGQPDRRERPNAITIINFNGKNQFQILNFKQKNPLITERIYKILKNLKSDI
jgi:hypothetical protein